VLFFRVGDFYEMFYEDAVVASKILQIALTSRDKGKKDAVPLCGVPYHAADTYIARLIRNGFKVAICEQIEDTQTAKGIVKREVVRVITPGTLLDPKLIEAKENNYLAGIFIDKGIAGVASADISTGDFFIFEVKTSGLYDELVRINPAEIIHPEGYEPLLLKGINATLNPYNEWIFDYSYAYDLLREHFKVNSLDGYGCEELKPAIRAAGALLHYLKETQKRSIDNIRSIKVYRTELSMIIDSVTQKNLELTKNLYDGGRKGTLIDVLDKTSTAMGGRLLKKWLLYPLIDVSEIKIRQEAVAEMVEEYLLTESLRGILKDISDMDRLIGRISLGVANARDLIALKNSISLLPRIKESLSRVQSNKLKSIADGIDTLSDLVKIIDESINDNPPVGLKEGGLIKKGYNEEIDDLRDTRHRSKEIITAIEVKERERTGIQSLKVRYNRVFGYYIEITKANLSQVPNDYIRKQTLVNAERFITPELKEYEEKVLSAEERIIELEYSLFEEIRKNVASFTEEVLRTAGFVAELDAILSLTEVARRNNYSRPVVNDEEVIRITEGRHPVLELIESDERFVPNDTLIDCDENQILIITGPNMAGKSTYMRQIALIVIMAQMGGFVPVKEAVIGTADRIFTRVGASDVITKGKSTFMVEMTETANILNNATRKSLILLDEIGRGTSTFDGISIAWATAEFIHRNIKAKTLFAT
ncbi:MAG: DNA mismatch repair protein MutS, partial [Nitrospirota bacterium]